MLQSIARKTRQVISDPVLRRWLGGRVLGLHGRETPFERHRPPYLAHMLPLSDEVPSGSFRTLPDRSPVDPISLPLAGETLHLDRAAVPGVFHRRFADVETFVSLHRFAWLPLLGSAIDPAWVDLLWREWRCDFASPRNDFSWEPYTAAERVINILDYAERVGLPGSTDDTLAVLAAHGPAVAAHLEYFGEQQTSNHLANNGRGLYLLGLALGLKGCADLGARILLQEAERLFRPSGVLREESSHYHLLLLKQYMSAWLAARSHARPETAALEAIVRRAAGVVPHLRLPGGFPLIGDISPDCPPAFLAGLVSGKGGWCDLLAPQDRQAVRSLVAGAPSADRDTLRLDGWLRIERGAWSGLWHGAPEGWSLASGHGHQDWGSCEIHHGGQRLIIDPGRGAYGDRGDAAFFGSAMAHNGILIDGASPYPPNRPYYDQAFRSSVAGRFREIVCTDDGVMARFDGFSRLGNVGKVTRRWRFSDTTLVVEDEIEGTGRHTVTRLLNTPLCAEAGGRVATLDQGSARWRVESDEMIAVEASTWWSAYGIGEACRRLRIEARVQLPWRGHLVVTAS
jgi:hypothetical protein